MVMIVYDCQYVRRLKVSQEPMPTLLRSQSKVLKEDKNIVAVTGSNAM